jgi:hypothetical protein
VGSEKQAKMKEKPLELVGVFPPRPGDNEIRVIIDRGPIANFLPLRVRAL